MIASRIDTPRIAGTARCLLGPAARTVLTAGTVRLPAAPCVSRGMTSLTRALHTLLGAPRAGLLALLISCGALVLQTRPASAATPAERNEAALATVQMMAGTSPSITAQSGGGYFVAFQANTGFVWTLTVTGNGGGFIRNWYFGMKAGTSPSTTVLSGGTPEMAFQANTGSLWSFYVAGCCYYYFNWNLAMMAGTSPSLAALSGGGYEIAFQANTGSLWIVGSKGIGSWGFGMMAGTSPSIAALPGGGFQIAFQSTMGHLITAGSGTGSRFLDAGPGMMAGTSPSITTLSGGGVEIAFQDNTGHLIAIGNASPPTITAVLTPAHPASTGWYNRATGAPHRPLCLQLCLARDRRDLSCRLYLPGGSKPEPQRHGH